MASLIRNLLRGGRGGSHSGVVQHTVGNALVLHGEHGISAEAQSLALTVVEDTEHDVVVLDLGAGLPIGSWESMAVVLPRRRRGIRLMACGEHRDAAALAGQWLSERLNRTVIAPDGELVRGAAGGLFVHSKPGSGWVRFRPGKRPTWDAKRYPTPRWDRAVTENRASSSTGEIEPLPGGVWIHDVRAGEVIAEHRRRLVADVPCQPDVMTVLLGCPGTAPLSLDDVVRFWRDTDPENRARTRFVQYGDIRLPDGEAFGQVLADLLAAEVVCYTGVPIGAPHRYEIRTVRGDGVLGWPPFALELMYTPRAEPNSEPNRPRIISHRSPLRQAEEVEGLVYWYAPDAVVEVVQAGLWVRPTEAPANAERVRATRLDPDGSTLIFDDSGASRTQRMRELAEDLAARIDSHLGQDTALVPASLLVLGQRPAGRADVGPAAADTRTEDQASTPSPAPPQPTAVIATMPAVEAVVPAAAATSAEPVTDHVTPPPAVAPTAPAVAPTAPAVAPTAPAVAPTASAPAVPPAPLAASVPPVAPAAAPPSPIVPIASAALEPVVARVEPSGPAATDPDQAGPAARPGVPATAPPVPGVVVRRQPVPAGSASALLPKNRPLNQERTWLRRTLSREFDTMASSVARIMSEYPGLQGSGTVGADDILTDSVAVRLYLTQRGAGVDAGLRAGATGPHVPIARSVAAGLSRLPSFRGATIYRASPLADEWKCYRERRLVTDWSFVNMLMAPCASQDGDTDVLVWSMTARRTGLLEPTGEDRVEDRVLFLPGTHFKVLELREPTGQARGAVLMREIGASEIDETGRVDPERVSLDELAVASLHRSLERWAAAPPVRRVGPGAKDRFGVLPGLERLTADEEGSGR